MPRIRQHILYFTDGYDNTYGNIIKPLQMEKQQWIFIVYMPRSNILYNMCYYESGIKENA